MRLSAIVTKQLSLFIHNVVFTLPLARSRKSIAYHWRSIRLPCTFWWAYTISSHSSFSSVTSCQTTHDYQHVPKSSNCSGTFFLVIVFTVKFAHKELAYNELLVIRSWILFANFTKEIDRFTFLSFIRNSGYKKNTLMVRWVPYKRILLYNQCSTVDCWQTIVSL